MKEESPYENITDTDRLDYLLQFMTVEGIKKKNVLTVVQAHIEMTIEDEILADPEEDLRQVIDRAMEYDDFLLPE